MAGAFYHVNATVSARGATAVTPGDTTNIPVCRALYIGTGGNLAVRMAQEGETITFLNVSAGIFPIQVDRVLSTGTTASNIIALY